MRPVRVHLRTGGDPAAEHTTYAISVPRPIGRRAVDADTYYRCEELPGGTLVFRPLVPIREEVTAS
ncbi:hypothetical protein NBH00_05070 [Paraconexibacter antarcticus]|uniref:Uncharacterized protein n=1 Tax=Paraconexibacter antarcticus TaxID=2949664 RepID=A0ABY5DWT0_9ACTN|nr:hypothetical protein [Paraconexibacter antarcticus]UTI65581.1 hypothetical protein NBH00_05070 [Paraconexibacter antarcticus]